MKNLFVLILFLTSIFFANAQKKIQVDESSYGFSVGRTNALTVTVYESNKDDVEKAWKKFIKKYKAKVSSKKEIFADDATIKNISANTIDVYAAAEVTKDGDVLLYVAFDLGGAFLSSKDHPSKFKFAKSLLYEFGVDATKEAIQVQLKAAEKVLKKMEGEQEKLVKENETLHKNIEGWQEDIKKAEGDIETNEKDQEAKKEEIEAQRKIVEEIIDKEKKVN